MRKKFVLLFLCLSVLLFAPAVALSANLLTSGDFTGVNIIYPFSENFSVDSGLYDTWLANGPRGTDQTTADGSWKVSPTGGPAGAGDYWAQHYVNSGVQIFQGIEGPGTGLFRVSLNYIYEEGAAGNTAADAWLYVLGLNSGQSYSIFDLDAPDVGAILFSQQLVPPDVDGWRYFSSDFTVGTDYDAWVYIVTASAFVFGEYPVPGLRGIDNAYLAPVPEPATMLLLGSGLIGLAGLRRKFRKS